MTSTTIYPTLLQCAAVSVALKFLLLPAYKSTVSSISSSSDQDEAEQEQDFEVHRNWLAITHSLPISRWYTEATSQWTLDYPPFFAYFEWLLSLPARLVDPAMLDVQNLRYDSWATIGFQRTTVIVSEITLLFALHRQDSSFAASFQCANGSRYVVYGNQNRLTQRHAIALSILLSPGLLIVDHIHFQYNGFLYGILLISMTLLRQQTSMLLGGILFAILLCFKHIYLYIAPAYFVYLLRAFVLDPKSVYRFRLWNAITLGIGVLAVFGVAIGPFAAMGQINQLKSRLFPFARGLCHAYWAPNVWAMYSFADRLLLSLSPYLNLGVDKSAINSVTRGLVGNTSFAVLPDISPGTCFALTLTFQLIPLVRLWTKPTWDSFVTALTLCGYSSFLFGWHVHEKAILLVLIPFSLVALKDRSYLSSFRPLAVAGHISLFPLLFTEAEFGVKVTYTVFWLVLFMYTFDRLAPTSTRRRTYLLDRLSLLYIAVSVPLMLYCSLVHSMVFQDRYEFLPLMFISTYCSLGVVGSWAGLLRLYLS